MKKEIEENKKQRSFKSKLIIFFINCFLLCFAIIAIYILVIFLKMPSLDNYLKETREPAIIFLDSKGNEIRSNNRIMGTPVSINNIPKHVWQAIIAIEDKRFFNHGAIDPKGLLRAVIFNLFKGRVAFGGSSITQQTAKNIFLSREKTISRKVQELILSYWLENRFEKEQILDLYINRVSLVGGMRGLDAASKVLFQKSVSQLSIAESAQIAAMLKAPTTYSPLKNPEKNISRAKLILKEMVKQQYITLTDARKANKELKPAKKNTEINNYRYWTDFVNEELNSRIDNINTDIYIYTTLDPNLQKKANIAISNNTGKYQGAGIILAKDGAILSMVGGVNYQKSQFNRCLSKRQPGSIFKPVVYLVALENGMKSTDIVNDSPITIGDYNPKNYNKRYYGNIPLSVAFAKSVNSVPLKLAKEFGIDTVIDMASRLGVGENLRKEYSTILGASEMSLLDLTTIYSVIWNNGNSVKPYSITKITDSKGKILFQRNPSDKIRLLNETTIKNMTKMLSDVIKSDGTGYKAATIGVIGGKTGTSNNNRDAWFIGATNSINVGIWIGNDDFSSMDSKITGGTIPAKIFQEIVKTK